MKADIHSHILCGIDDGAKNLEESERLLTGLSQSGIRQLALTPHYYPYQQSLECFLEKRQIAFQKIQTLPVAEKFCFSLGAEVYLTETLFNNQDLSALCYEGTSFMLTELEYADDLTASVRSRLRRLREDCDIIPVLAHVDRYPFLWKSKRTLAELMDQGCYFQVNLSAFQTRFATARTRKLFEKGFVHFLGEDVHSECLNTEQKKLLFGKAFDSDKGFVREADERAFRAIFAAK